MSDDRPGWLRRSGGIAIATVANLILILMLLTLAPAPTPDKPMPGGRATTVDLLPDDAAAPDPSPAEEPQEAAAVEQPPAPVEKVRPDTPLVVPKAEVADAPAPPLNMIVVDRDVLAATDTAMRTKSAGASAGDSNRSGPGDNRPAGGPRGPNGETLYAAQWYREPTDAELGGYMPSSSARTGWGQIACRTVSQYRVEDCAEIGEYPRGSGFARAVRQAAWQFRVLPPRVNGRPQVGEWVSIRITYGQADPG